MLLLNALNSSRRRFIAAALAASVLLGGCASVLAPSVSPAARDELAPTGVLRVAVYPGSPTSFVEQVLPEGVRGVSVVMGRALAGHLGVPAQIIVYPCLAEALAALQQGDADFTITNATTDRARSVDFASMFVDLELGVLILTASRLGQIERLDEPGVTVGVSQGSSSERVLGSRLKNSKLGSFPTLNAAREALQAGEIDGFATNKEILFELGAMVAGPRVLEGNWGAKHLALALPKGRDNGKSYLQSFIEEVRGNGELDVAIRRAGLRRTEPISRQ